MPFKAGKIAALFVSLLILGCAAYDVRVTGFAKNGITLARGERIYVYRDPEADNPLFEEEVAGKIEKALEMKGFEIVKGPGDARYALTYRYEIDSGIKIVYPIDDYDLRIATGRYGITRTIVKVLHTRSLTLKIYEGVDPARIEAQKPLWVGEAISRGEEPDLRSVVSYLIIGAVEHLGEDTKKQRWHTISSTDGRIKALSDY